MINNIDNLHTLPFCNKIFQGKLDGEYKGLSLSKCESIYHECLSVAENILQLVHSGVRYRDIGIACCDIKAYSGMLESVFDRCNIPLYTAGTENILDKTVIATILSAMDTAINGFEQKDVLRYLKTTLSPLDENICDNLENYVISWGITGQQWFDEWTGHPKGLGERWTEDATNLLQQLNDARETAMNPLRELRKKFDGAKNVGQMVLALYGFLEEIDLAGKLSVLAQEME